VATVVRTNLSAVLAAVRTRIQDVLLFPPERVLVVASDDHPDLQADQLVWLRARRQSWEKAATGGGRFNNVVKRRCTVTLRTRLLLDAPADDLAWLTDASLGHYAREHSLFDALECFQPVDDDDNWLVHEPIHLADAGDAERPPDCAGWGQAVYGFDVSFTLDLDQGYQ